MKDLITSEEKKDLFRKNKKVIITNEIKETGNYDVRRKGSGFMKKYFTGVAFVTFRSEKMFYNLKRNQNKCFKMKK